MQTANIREKLHQFIDEMDDKKAEAFYTLLADENDAGAQRKKLVQAEREVYLKGEGKSFSWEEVKDMALNKYKRHVL